jgi:hypothetical protein
MSADLRYPIGNYQWPATISAEERARKIATLWTQPQRLRDAVHGLSEAQIQTPYREGGWTVRQVVHHVPESHMNSYIRFKLALTESNPTVKPYDEAAWARLSDVDSTPVETSLCLLENLHSRWDKLLRSLSEADWKREFVHPQMGPVSLEKNLALYAWHGDHHIAHITELRRRNGW